jgi:hypothetical protein
MVNNGIRSWEMLLAEAIGGDAALRVISQAGEDPESYQKPRQPASTRPTQVANNEIKPRRSSLLRSFMGEGI